MTQFDKDDLEKIGLVKFDFLGLRTLTILAWAVEAINARRGPGEPALDLSRIPLDDPATYQLIQEGRTVAVFQLESAGMRRLAMQLKPDCFEDLIALVALFRPGPLESGMAQDFIDRKHGKVPIRYPHPALEPILKPTYGTIVYQEQVMQIAQVLAGYSLGEADLLRRAMGKKDAEEMARQRENFVRGAEAKGWSAHWPAKFSTRWRSLRATVSTNPTPRHTPFSPTKPPGSRRTTRRRSWPPCCPPTWTTAMRS